MGGGESICLLLLMSGTKFMYIYLAMPLNAEWLLYLWLYYQILGFQKLENAVSSLLLKVFDGH
jgi:hypothetical protein